MTDVTVFGAEYSVYVRSVCLTLREKGVAYRLESIDVFGAEGAPASHRARQPFGKIPAFRHDDFALYETSAINRYVDEVFPGPSLQPREPQLRARMNQAIGILDSYAYRTLVWDLYVERIVKRTGADEARIASALPHAATCLRALDELGAGGVWLATPELTLADLHAAPMLAYFTQTPESQLLLEPHERLRRWWARLSARDSVRSVCASSLAPQP